MAASGSSPLACVDCDECRDPNCGGGAITNVCAKNSDCHNTVGSYRCLCKDGYAESLNNTFSAKSCISKHEAGLLEYFVIVKNELSISLARKRLVDGHTVRRTYTVGCLVPKLLVTRCHHQFELHQLHIQLTY